MAVQGDWMLEETQHGTFEFSVHSNRCTLPRTGGTIHGTTQECSCVVSMRSCTSLPEYSVTG